ncbi:LLM class flavin-dependent oxidoreductase [Actinocrinis sp.]|uniref:LLM class flavin-dependent oxidoreductase n=1 Tax=Actinocrinis sp. TaxID=1920516 RepID=UPI002D6ECE65|nr:LLM class flavin-dependent oxidoreductase [Actinocrinis sp.]HZP49640.1 LLM class flavin-dependent oxidoreductase [Actinocrinis sp.]
MPEAFKTPPGLAVQAGTVPLLVAAAAAAERHGLPALWSSEFYDRSAVVTLAALAGATSRVRLGSSIAWAFGRTPVTVATDFRSLDQLAPGRVSLGLGPGNPQVVAEWHGLDEPRPAARLAELVTLIREIWAVHERPVAHDGTFYRCILPADPTLPPLAGSGPPILLAGGRSAMTRVAGAVADGLIGMPVASPDFVAQVIRPTLAEGAARTGRGGAVPITGMTICAIADTTARARAVAAMQLAVFIVRRSCAELVAFHGFEREVAAVGEAAARRDFPAMAAAIPDRMLDLLTVYGTPEEARQRYREVFDGVYEESLLFASGKGRPSAGFQDEIAAVCETFATV